MKSGRRKQGTARKCLAQWTDEKWSAEKGTAQVPNFKRQAKLNYPPSKRFPVLRELLAQWTEEKCSTLAACAGAVIGRRGHHSLKKIYAKGKRAA